MSVLAWILVGGVLMSTLALVGAVTLVLHERQLQRILLPLVALAAGSLLGGAFFHMIPAAVGQADDPLSLLFWVLVGFSSFLALEQFLHWHHCHRADAACGAPVTYLILLGDGLHNFLGGLAVAGAFLLDVRVGITTWLAAAAHEVPQELGDFGVLVHAGWGKGRALLFNFISASTFLLGGLIAYLVSFEMDVGFLLPFAAGNFIYIAASDLVPEVNKQRDLKRSVIHFGCFLGGVAVLYLLAKLLGS